MKTRIPDHPAIPARRLAPGIQVLALGLACLAAPLFAEDPLLGRIKVIKCVGCNPGEVKLVVHDPIDVRDFEVRIKESDYQKIISPLAGKTIYDKGGCFYWMEPHKSTPARAAVPPTRMPGTLPDSVAADTGKPGMPSGIDSTPPDTAQAAADPEGTPSRCIPFEKVQVKASEGGGKRGKSEE